MSRSDSTLPACVVKVQCGSLAHINVLEFAGMSQLRMEKCDLDNVPEVALPKGYRLRTYQAGDEVGIARIYEASVLGNERPEDVRERIIQHPCFTPERLFLVEHEGELVGTAAAWIEDDTPPVGYLHMVGVLPLHRGKHLGLALTVVAIRFNAMEGFRKQRLSTDDWRESALRMYLDLGYYPLLTDDTHPERWAVLAKKLGRPNALALARDVRPAIR
jgi:mycothiol synthase